MIVFRESAFTHGYSEEDFFEVLASRPFNVRSRRGIEGVYELYGQNNAGDYLHIAYREEPGRLTVFHLRRMTRGEREYYRRRR